MRQHAASAIREKDQGLKANTRPTLFQHIAQSDMPLSELHEDRLTMEAGVIMIGGVHTTARTLEYIAYHVVANEQIKRRLQEELEPVMAGFPEKIPSLVELENLPYLSGVIAEGLR